MSVIFEIETRNRTGLKNHTGHINNSFTDEKLRKKIWNHFATYISPTNRLANCLLSLNVMHKKNSEKNYNIVPWAFYIFDVGHMHL